jgi:hypothetical protein
MAWEQFEHWNTRTLERNVRLAGGGGDGVSHQALQ